MFLDNIDINKLLAKLSKMDKNELERSLEKAKQLINKSNIKDVEKREK